MEAKKICPTLETGKKYNKSYNAIRGFAAAGIFLSHMSYLEDSDVLFWRGLYTLFFRHGSSCSSLFYIMSGFFALYTWKDTNFRKYISGKMKKIYPLVLGVLLLAIAIDVAMGGSETVSGNIAVGSRKWWFNVFMGITMLKAFVPWESTFYSFHGPSWYMSALVVFYVLFWLIAQRITNSGYEMRKKAWGGVILTCITAYILQAGVCLAVDIKELKNIRLWVTYVNPYFRIFGECFLGMIIAGYTDKIKKNDGNRRKWLAAALLSIPIILLLKNIIHTSLLSAWVWAVPSTCLLAAFFCDEGKGAEILHAKPFQTMGDISFELYMTHAFVYEGLPIMSGIVNDNMRKWLVSHAGIRFVITAVLSILAAWLIHMILNTVSRKNKICDAILR